MSLFSMDGAQFILRWGHYLAGVTWIGLLYYFNFIQGSWFAETDASSKSAAVQKLVPRALWWFRWGAMFTFITGFFILMIKSHLGGMAIFSQPWGIFILPGAAMGTFMFLNVWLIIWPNQKVVIASAQQVAGGGSAIPEAAACGAKAGLASRTNTLFSIPMLFLMGAASHMPLSIGYDANLGALALVLALIIGACELNGVIGKLGPMKSVTGVIHSGLALTIVLYAAIEFLT
jgi:uncharacterized membrane protein